MSVILDVLRRRSREGCGEADPLAACGERVAATLGFQRAGYPRRMTFGTLLLLGGGAIAFGFVAFATLLALLAPGPTAPSRSPAGSARPAQAQAGTTQPSSERSAQPPKGGAQTALTASGALSTSELNKPDARWGGPGGTAPGPLTPDATSGHASDAARAGGGVERPRRPVPEAASPGRPTRRPVPEAASPERPTAAPPAAAPASTVTAAVSLNAPGATDPFGLALYYHRAGDFENALAQYRLVLDENGSSADAHSNLGVLYLDRGSLDEAVAHFRRAIAIEPRHVKAHNNLGVVHLRAGRFDLAAANLAAALAVDPHNVESLVNLALVGRATGRPGEARDLLMRALRIDPGHPGTHYNLAVIADEQGDTGTAIAHYRTFLKLETMSHQQLGGQVRARLAALNPT
jgi:Flp pilus assembly protein TadD